MKYTKVKIKEICRIVSGTTPKTNKEEFWNGNISWITPAEIKDNSFYIYSTERTITQEGKDKNNLFLMPKGTVLLSSRAPIGKVAIAGIDMCCNQGFKNLICSNRINNEFLYYFFKSKTEFLNSLGRGATFKELSKSIVENINISLPSLQEQFFIKEKLKKIDSLINLKYIFLQKINELVNSRFMEMFGDPIVNDKKLKEEYFVNVVKLQRGFDLPVQSREKEGIFPVIGANGIVGFHDQYKATYGIVTGRSGTIGNVYLVEGKYWPLNTTLFSIDTHGNNIIYLKWLLQFFKLERFVAGTGVPTLNRNNFHNVKIISVSIDEQNQFACFVKKIDKSKLAVQKSIDHLEILKKSLMQEYFG